MTDTKITKPVETRSSAANQCFPSIPTIFIHNNIVNINDYDNEAIMDGWMDSPIYYVMHKAMSSISLT